MERMMERGGGGMKRQCRGWRGGYGERMKGRRRKREMEERWRGGWREWRRDGKDDGEMEGVENGKRG